MEEIKLLVVRARSGDLEAFGDLVRRFQDMAHGCAYSLLGDFHRRKMLHRMHSWMYTDNYHYKDANSNSYPFHHCFHLKFHCSNSVTIIRL